MKLVITSESESMSVREDALIEVSNIIDFYGCTNQMVIGLVLPLLAIADGHQLISDEE